MIAMLALVKRLCRMPCVDVDSTFIVQGDADHIRNSILSRSVSGSYLLLRLKSIFDRNGLLVSETRNDVILLSSMRRSLASPINLRMQITLKSLGPHVTELRCCLSYSRAFKIAVRVVHGAVVVFSLAMLAAARLNASVPPLPLTLIGLCLLWWSGLLFVYAGLFVSRNDGNWILGRIRESVYDIERGGSEDAQSGRGGAAGSYSSTEF